MQKTTVYLSTEQKAALASAAREQGRSEAHLIRDGIAGVVTRHRLGEAAPSLSADPPPGDAAGADPGGRSRWVSREWFVRLVVPVQADAGLRADLRELAPDLTDEVPGR